MCCQQYTMLGTSEWGVCVRVQTAIAACEPGGRIVLVGMGQDNMTLPMALASIREIDIYGSFRYCNTVCRADGIHPKTPLPCRSSVGTHQKCDMLPARPCRQVRPGGSGP